MAVAALVAAAATTAHAAVLPVRSEQVFAYAAPANAMPVVAAPFDTGGNGSLDGRTTSTGQVWDVVSGLMNVNNGEVRCGGCNGSYAIAIVDAGMAQVTAAVDVLVGGSASGGLMLNANQNGTTGFMVLYSNGSVRLLRRSSGTTTQLATGSTAVSSNVRLVVTYTNGAYSISTNGQPVLNYSLSPADRGIADGNTHFGVVLYDANGANRLDNFTVTQ